MGNEDNDRFFIGTAVVLVAAVILFWVSWRLAGYTPWAEVPPGGPLVSLREFLSGRASYPRLAAVLLVATITPLGAAAYLWFLRRSQKSDLMKQAKHLKTSKSISRYTKPKHGPIMGHTRKATLRMTNEDVAVVIAGARSGKTTTIGIDAIVGHTDGPVLATSNKDDIRQLVTGPRSEIGTVYVFDPQRISSNEQPTFFFDPLTTARTYQGAEQLAKVFMDAKRETGDRVDPHFYQHSTELLQSFLLAAALDPSRSMVDIVEWANNPNSQTAQVILEDFADFAMVANTLKSKREITPKERSGIYSGVQKAVSWATDPTVRPWFTPTPGRQRLDLTKFVDSKDTLILLSQDEGSATGLVTALTVAVLQTAEDLAEQGDPRYGRRLQKPLLAMLDEAANIVRWRALPAKFSHYGSRGINLIAMFQSYEQIEEAYGKTGASTLWSSANVGLYLGGVRSTRFLTELSKACGDYDRQTKSRTRHSQGRTNISTSTQRTPILPISLLAQIEPGEGVAFLSGAAPTAITLTPWWNGPNADRIQQHLEPEPPADRSIFSRKIPEVT